MRASTVEPGSVLWAFESAHLFVCVQGVQLSVAIFEATGREIGGVKRVNRSQLDDTLRLKLDGAWTWEP